MEKSPRQSSPRIVEGAWGSNAALWVVCLQHCAIFIEKERKERDSGVDCLHVTPQILASTPRFLINVILIGFRSLETTK